MQENRSDQRGAAPSEMSTDPHMEIQAGRPAPLGARCVDGGVNFALFSRHAEAVDLCLFDVCGTIETAVLRLPGKSGDVWHGFVPGLGAGQAYGYRVHGPYSPRQGHRFNPSKLLLDPYAISIIGELKWAPEVFGYGIGADEEGGADGRDSAPFVQKCVVVDLDQARPGRARPRNPWNETVIYELHVKGFTRLHPDVPDPYRGTYLGLAQPPVMEYLRSLGVTAVELLPCQAFVSEQRLVAMGLSNYWGYNPLAMFAPHPGYAVSDPVTEFRQMVDALHGAGIEVILDVVFNHTAEGSEAGPTLSFRGIDSLCYYLLDPADLRRAINFSGCGNSLDVSQPDVLRMVMDCLRFWTTEMGVDGFRFDLATTLGRRGALFDRRGGFFSALHQDPVLSGVKLIAEPWDLGPEGYRLGQFPPPWAEWNDRYRETVRGFWRGDPDMVSGFAERIAGSSDFFRSPGRQPTATINYAACHDGFTLRDLVSYQHKHNEGNLEANRDGHHHNVSWNCGVEGETEDKQVLATRRRHRHNLLATTMLSQGVPMLMAGDEFGRTQHGNNNAYCQDNDLSWVDWDLRQQDSGTIRLVALLTRIRRENPVFRRISFLRGVAHPESRLKDVTWLKENGAEMSEVDWRDPDRRTLGVLLDRTGVDPDHRDPDDREPGGSFLLLFNAGNGPVDFTLPAPIASEAWAVVLDTGMETAAFPDDAYGIGQAYPLGAQCLALLGEPG